MAEAAVEPARNPFRFFCHRCNIEFEDVIQSNACPYCATGFIEQLENSDGDSLLRSLEEGEFSDAEMSTLDDAGGTDDSILDESLEGSNTNFMPPMLNDLAFLMSGGRSRSAGSRPPQQGRQETLMEQLVWMVGGGRAVTGAVTAGAPFVLVGAPGDYVFGGDGLDAVVTQLLGQLENTGPAPLLSEQIEAIPSVAITAEQVEANLTCSVCWEAFTLGETVSRLVCSHIFHPCCINPWLQLHATCPICRRSLMPPGPLPAPRAASDTNTNTNTNTNTDTDTNTNTDTDPGSQDGTATGTGTVGSPSISRVLVRRLPARRRRVVDSSSSASSASVGGLWAQLTSSISSLANAGSSSSSLNSSDRYMDIDYD